MRGVQVHTSSPAAVGELLLCVEVPPMPHLNSLDCRAPVGSVLPDGVDVWPVEVACAVPSPTPYCGRSDKPMLTLDGTRRFLTVLGTGHEVQRLALLVSKETVMGPEPLAVLRIRARVIWETSQANVTSY